MKQSLAVFDIDGTLYDSQLGVELLRELSYLDAIYGVSREEFDRQYNEFVLTADKSGYYDTHFDDYYTNRLKGVNKAVFDEASKKVADHAYPHFYNEVLEELEDRKKENYFIILISKSPIQAIAELANLLAADAYWGWQFNFDENQNYVDQYTYDNGTSDKAYIVRHMVEEHDLTFDQSYAYGDSAGDISLLRIVKNPTAVNPEPALMEEAKKEGWRILQTIA
jgi:HAD superfamily hydrolase (TIGR01490 family)